MSIDGIGRPPGGPAGIGPAAGATPATSGDAFQVERSASAAGPQDSGPLARLTRGEINVEQYLDARVEEAVAPIASKVPAEALDFIRSSLRTELESDPVLVELVRRATSGAPPASSGT
ncbi:MAG: hypothetical protein QM756_28320 [Polyangiaceae bacterium]